MASVLFVGCSKPATKQSGNAALLSFSDQRGLELGTYPDRVLRGHFSVDEIRGSAKSYQRLVQRKYLSNISYSGDLLFVEGREILVVSPNYSAKSLNSKYFNLGFELRHDMVAVSPDGKTIAAIIPTYISSEELVGELWAVEVASGKRSKIMSVRLQTQGKVTWSHDSKAVFLYKIVKGKVTTVKVDLATLDQTDLTLQPMAFASDSPVCIAVDPTSRELQVVEFEPSVKVLRNIPATEDLQGVSAFMQTGEALLTQLSFNLGETARYTAADWKSGNQHAIPSSPNEVISLIKYPRD